MNGYRSTCIKGKQFFLPLYLLKKYLKNTNSEIVQEKPKNNQTHIVFDLGSNTIVAKNKLISLEINFNGTDVGTEEIEPGLMA